MRLAAALLMAAPLLAGCTLVPPPQPRDVTGSVEGYDPTTSFLKVHVRTADGIVLADFDRRDWNVNAIARMIDERALKALSVHGMPREILNEVLVEVVGDPSELARFRWTSQTSPEERAAAEKAYDELVARFQAGGVEAPDVSAPSGLIPSPELP